MGSGRPSSEGTKKKEPEDEGWTRRFVACEPRLSEAVDLYRRTGQEVRLEPLTREGKPDSEGRQRCNLCFQGFEDRYRVIYTRQKRRGHREEAKKANR